MIGFDLRNRCIRPSAARQSARVATKAAQLAPVARDPGETREASRQTQQVNDRS